MFVIFKGPLNAHGELASRVKLPKSFETQEQAREYVLAQLKRDFPQHEYDADNDIWWGRNKGDAQATGYLIQNA